MIGMLNSFIEETANSVQAKIGDDDIFRPVDLVQAAVTVFGVRMTNTDNTGEGMKRLFSSCGMNQPVLIANDNVGPSIRQAKRTDFYTDINFVPVVPAQSPRALLNVQRMSNLEEFLFMTKGNNMRWFDLLLTQAITHARFFGNVENLSSVPTVGGLETCVVGQLKRDTHNLNALFYDSLDFGTYALNNANPPVLANTHQARWYDQKLKNVTCGFATNRAGTSRRESLQAMAFATNSLPFVDAAHLTGIFRTGKLYENVEWTESYDYEGDEFGKPMFVSWTSVVRNMFTEKPGPVFDSV